MAQVVQYLPSKHEFNPQVLPSKPKKSEESVVTHIYNPSTQEAEAGGLQVQCQPELYSETLSERKTVSQGGRKRGRKERKKRKEGGGKEDRGGRREGERREGRTEEGRKEAKKEKRKEGRKPTYKPNYPTELWIWWN
jgi:hypothetical protein